MKKLILLLLVLSTVLSLFGCAQVQEPEFGSHIHNWVEATCTKPITCTLCGETRGFPAGHRFNLGYCDFCSATDPTYGTQPDTPNLPEATTHEHNWNAATCFTPEYCTTCGVIGSGVLGHSYISGKCERCGSVQSQATNAHSHNWQSATCSKPMTCTTCGETLGSRLAHNYLPATCTTPKTCSFCNRTDGNALGHSYSSGVCSRCSDKDNNYVKTYSVGEKWVVDGQWEITIDAVTTHPFCSNLSTYENLKNTCEQCVQVTFSYKNLGYTGSIQTGLYIAASTLTVYDEKGEAAEIYEILGCDHSKRAKEISPGNSCSGAQWTYALYSKSNTVTVEIEHYTSNSKKEKAKFIVPVTASGSGSSSSGNGTENWNQSTLDKMLDDILQGNAFAGTVKTFANSSLNATNSTARQMDASSATLMATECKSELSAALSAAKSGPEIRLTQGDYATVKDALQAAYNLISGVSGLAVTSSNCGTVANNCKTAATKVDAITMSILRELVWNE